MSRGPGTPRGTPQREHVTVCQEHPDPAPTCACACVTPRRQKVPVCGDTQLSLCPGASDWGFWKDSQEVHAVEMLVTGMGDTP